MDCHQSSSPLRSWCQSFAILTSINHVLLGSSFKPRRPSPGLLPATYLREYQGNGDIISPEHPGFALDPPPGRTCLEHLTFTCEHVCITLTNISPSTITSLQRVQNTQQWNPKTKHSSRNRETSRNSNRRCDGSHCDNTQTPIRATWISRAWTPTHTVVARIHTSPEN